MASGANAAALAAANPGGIRPAGFLHAQQQPSNMQQQMAGPIGQFYQSLGINPNVMRTGQQGMGPTQAQDQTIASAFNKLSPQQQLSMVDSGQGGANLYDNLIAGGNSQTGMGSWMDMANDRTAFGNAPNTLGYNGQQGGFAPGGSFGPTPGGSAPPGAPGAPPPGGYNRSGGTPPAPRGGMPVQPVGGRTPGGPNPGGGAGPGALNNPQLQALLQRIFAQAPGSWMQGMR